LNVKGGGIDCHVRVALIARVVPRYFLKTLQLSPVLIKPLAFLPSLGPVALGFGPWSGSDDLEHPLRRVLIWSARLSSKALEIPDQRPRVLSDITEVDGLSTMRKE